MVVEDDVAIADEVALALRREGLAVDVVHDGPAGLDSILINPYAVVVLEWMLPGMDGLAVCQAARRAQVSVPVLMLTARDQVSDRVEGLEAGADDYLVKPFDVRELTARVRALVRRDKAVKSGVVQFADLELDSQTKRVVRAGREINLTPREFELLEALVRNRGRTLTREVILNNVWGADENTENAVNFHVTSLRRKVDSWHPVKLIHTVHGFGYTLRAED